MGAKHLSRPVEGSPARSFVAGSSGACRFPGTVVCEKLGYGVNDAGTSSSSLSRLVRILCAPTYRIVQKKTGDCRFAKAFVAPRQKFVCEHPVDFAESSRILADHYPAVLKVSQGVHASMSNPERAACTSAFRLA